MKKAKFHTPIYEDGLFSLILKSVGNPDYGQYAPLSTPSLIHEPTLDLIIKTFRKYVYEHELGSGNVPRLVIKFLGKPFCHISYNGGLWEINKDKPYYDRIFPGDNSEGPHKVVFSQVTLASCKNPATAERLQKIVNKAKIVPQKIK